MHESARAIAGIAALLLTLLAARPAAAGPMDAPGYAKAFACSACHGLGGASRADTMPVLAGMSPQYFKKAIEDYASGRRPSAEMQPFARMVLELGLDEVAAYFAAQPFAPTPIAVASAAARASRRNLSTSAGEVLDSVARNFMATSRSSALSYALKTVPIAPRPISSRTS